MIADEWQSNIVAKDLTVEQVAACDSKMWGNCPEGEIVGYEVHQSFFSGVDPKNRHVSAAAHQWATGTPPDGGPAARKRFAPVTWNTKDFCGVTPD